MASSSSSSSIMESLFQRSLEDIIKGLRLQIIGESAFVSKSMEEVRKEIKSTDPDTKSIALQKLTYFNSLHGVDMSWAAFHVVEVIGSPVFRHKKIGYLAASQSFQDSTDVILLITNQLRKDINSSNEFEVSLALECLSRIATVDLARDLSPELFTLLSSRKSLVRKKVTGVILRVFSKCPDAVRVCFKRLVENLESFDPQTVSATVGVFCELAGNDPKTYIPLAPEFYRILIDSKNNWALIKVLKIFAKLAPLEQRLAKRVVGPICELMRKTGAKSLMFECVRTIVTSLDEYESAVKLAVVKIQELLLDDDPNLKFLGLQALSIVAPKHFWAVLDSKEVVIKSLSDLDPNIKLESLRLLMGMVTEDNVIEICRVLVNYALKSDPEFCNEILDSILSTCGRNYYEIVVDFDWYVFVLGEMSRIPHCQKGEEIENQLIDIGMRVKDVRQEIVRVGRDLLIDPALLSNPCIYRILCACSWVSGEYVEFSKNPFELMEALLQPRTNLLPPSIRAVYIQSAFKVLVFCLHSYFYKKESILSSLSDEKLAPESSDLGARDEGFNPRLPHQSSDDLPVKDGEDMNVVHGQTPFLFTHESIVNMVNQIEMSLGPLSVIHEVELHDRVRNVLGFLGLIKLKLSGNIDADEPDVNEMVKLMHDAFCEDLGPVSTIAQQRVPLPDGLLLKHDLSDLELICGDIQLPSTASFSFGNPDFRDNVTLTGSDLHCEEQSEASNNSTYLITEHRKRHGLYYLPSEKNEDGFSDYPPANIPKLNDILDDDAEDLVKLTEQSFGAKRKTNHSKSRPVVVTLDEGEAVSSIVVKQPEVHDGMLSGAVRDALSGKKSSKKGKEKVNVDFLVESKENLVGVEKGDLGNSSSRRSKHHHGDGKERRHGSSGKAGEEGDSNAEKAKQKKKSNHRNGKQKARQRSDGPLSTVTQSQVIPDFLL